MEYLTWGKMREMFSDVSDETPIILTDLSFDDGRNDQVLTEKSCGIEKVLTLTQDDDDASKTEAILISFKSNK